MTSYKRVVTLCSSSCCPVLTVDLDNKTVVITNDYEGKITITQDEFELAYMQYLEILKSAESCTI